MHIYILKHTFRVIDTALSAFPCATDARAIRIWILAADDSLPRASKQACAYVCMYV